jgi:glycosyltransferase involved in cell wall biosynthesis
LVHEELAAPAAPEILLIEKDVPFNRRGGVYTGADCYVHPLRAEGFAMTILEAMACGLPVIATPWSGPADILSPLWAYTIRHSGPVPERNQNGDILRFHVEPELEHLIYLMRYVYEHQAEARNVGRKAAGVAHGNWTWKHAAVKLASALHLPTRDRFDSERLSQMSPPDHEVTPAEVLDPGPPSPALEGQPQANL